MNTTETILLASNLPSLLALYLILNGQKPLTYSVRALAQYIVVAVAIQVISVVIWILDMNNMPLLHIYVPMGFLLISRFYERVLRGYIHNWVLRGIAISFVAYSILNTIFFQGVWSFNSNALFVKSLTITIYCISVFILLLDEGVKSRMKDNAVSIHWINSGFFIYYTSDLFIFYSGQSLHRFSDAINQNVWLFHAFFYILMYVCFMVGLWKSRRR